MSVWLDYNVLWISRGTVDAAIAQAFQLLRPS